MSKVKFLFAIMTILITGSARSQSPSFIKDSLDSYIERGMKQWQIPGLAITIVKDGKVVAIKGFGVRE